MPFIKIRKWWGVIKQKTKSIIDFVKNIPEKILNFGKNTIRYIGHMIDKPTDFLKELPLDILKLSWSVVKNVLDYYDERTTLVTEFLYDFSTYTKTPQLILLSQIFKKLNDARIPITDYVKKEVYTLVDGVILSS